MNYSFFLDVRPDPVPVAGVSGLILLAFVVVMFAAALVFGFVFLLKRLSRSNIRVSSPTVREGLPLTRANRELQPSNPNQP